LTPPGEQFAHLLLLGRGSCGGPWSQGFAKGPQHRSIDGIGFRLQSFGSGKSPQPTGKCNI